MVSTRVGDVESVLRGVEPSRIVDRDPDAVAVALEEVAALGVRSNGRKRVSEFATPAISARSLAFYREVLTVGRKAGRT